MSRTQHRASAFAVLLSLLPFAVAQAAPVPSANDIVALVKLSAQLEIDQTIFSSGYDAKTHPYVKIRNAPEGTVGGYLVPEGANGGTLHDGSYALAVPLESGGSGGIFTQVVFSGRDAKTLEYVGFIDSGGHLAVTVKDGAIVARFPYYGDDTPNCCPKKFIVQTYRIQDGRLVKVAERFEPA